MLGRAMRHTVVFAATALALGAGVAQASLLSISERGFRMKWESLTFRSVLGTIDVRSN